MGTNSKKITKIMFFLCVTFLTRAGCFLSEQQISTSALSVVNPCPAELFQLYFSSFEAGIANAISSFK